MTSNGCLDICVKNWCQKLSICVLSRILDLISSQVFDEVGRD